MIVHQCSIQWKTMTWRWSPWTRSAVSKWKNLLYVDQRKWRSIPQVQRLERGSNHNQARASGIRSACSERLPTVVNWPQFMPVATNRCFSSPDDCTLSHFACYRWTTLQVVESLFPVTFASQSSYCTHAPWVKSLLCLPLPLWFVAYGRHQSSQWLD